MTTLVWHGGGPGSLLNYFGYQFEPEIPADIEDDEAVAYLVAHGLTVVDEAHPLAKVAAVQNIADEPGPGGAGGAGGPGGPGSGRR